MISRKNIKKLWIVSFIIICFMIGIIWKLDGYITINNNLSIPEDRLNEIIKSDIEPVILKPTRNGKIFCTYKVIGYGTKFNSIYIYLSCLAEEYYKQGQDISIGTAGVFPVVIKVTDEDYKVLNIKMSKDEESKDALKIYPPKLREKALTIGDNFGKDDISKVEDRARKYFIIK